MIVLVAGGTGFLGKRVVHLLEEKGHKVVLYHRKFRAVPTYADVIVNCVGIIKERGQTFKEAHVDVTKWLIGLGKKLKVRQFVQVSVIGADLEGVPYQRTKAQAELLIFHSGMPYVIIRPSMIFGPDDKSISVFRKIARTGFFPLLADAKVQPVHVDTVAAVVVAAAEERIRRKVVEIGGPEVFTYKELAHRIHPGVTMLRLPPYSISLLTFLGAFVPALPTRDMVVMMNQNNVTRDRTIGRLRIKNKKLA